MASREDRALANNGCQPLAAGVAPLQLRGLAAFLAEASLGLGAWGCEGSEAVATHGSPETLSFQAASPGCFLLSARGLGPGVPRAGLASWSDDLRAARAERNCGCALRLLQSLCPASLKGVLGGQEEAASPGGALPGSAEGFLVPGWGRAGLKGTCKGETATPGPGHPPEL